MEVPRATDPESGVGAPTIAQNAALAIPEKRGIAVPSPLPWAGSDSRPFRVKTPINGEAVIVSRSRLAAASSEISVRRSRAAVSASLSRRTTLSDRRNQIRTR